ncbi:hypothetical protein [Nakamurella deserti]|uniref:hypothetical protein n=1 Tax=Nakamurella deserti TaxID=2164074 RepID=UPI000DBEA8C3|nr:hypothetical protein [Nakamurella deserti]
MTQADPGGLRPAVLRKAIVLAVILALLGVAAASDAAAGEPFDAGGVFLPVGAVLVLLLSRPTFAVVDRHRRPLTGVAGLVIVVLVAVGLAGGPGPFRLIAAVLFAGVGVLFVAGALLPSVAARLPGFFPGLGR